jgi:hypothetical protein
MIALENNILNQFRTYSQLGISTVFYQSQIYQRCSTCFDTDEVYAINPVNQRILNLIEDFKTLDYNWDEDGALKPSLTAIRLSTVTVKQLQLVSEKVFHAAPGPNGEIMIDLRKNGKSVEILFYENKSRFVTFPTSGKPEQGVYDEEQLPKLLKWLNG